MTYDAIVFDVDGVLIDTSRSFSAAVLDAVALATGSEGFTGREAALLKTLPGFNNDWHVAIAGAAWITFSSGLSFAEFARAVESAGSGLAGVRRVAGSGVDKEFERRLTRLAQEAYGGSSACAGLYGFEPTTIRQPGHWREEVPLLTAEQIQPLASRAGIVTGRSAAETELAFELLGWRLSAAQVAVSDESGQDKPNPEKLLAILQHLKSRKAILAGDGRDDLELARNARLESGNTVDFCYIGSGSPPWPGAEWAFGSVTEMLKQVEVYHG